jgi:hypothetical protein
MSYIDEAPLSKEAKEVLQMLLAPQSSKRPQHARSPVDDLGTLLDEI